ncbi:hypothetical protein [Actinophytocola sp. NPDC049390]|uniref:hypothetical protein n=1 Tax=Actinophytocola sp. NPDC049390 TaxID=3363894 RepID=UPI0037936A9D
MAESVTPNFHQGFIAYRGRTVAVVRGREMPVMAIAEPRVAGNGGVEGAGPLTFVEAPELAVCLAELSGCRVLTVVELNGPFDAVAWPRVSAGDVAYWRPGTLGEALFNYWD